MFAIKNIVCYNFPIHILLANFHFVNRKYHILKFFYFPILIILETDLI